MKKIFYIKLILLLGFWSVLLTPLNIQAQTNDPLVYNWQWAFNGGGSLGRGPWSYSVEQILDVVVDSKNNYYFLANITNGSPKLAGEPVTVYGNLAGGNDIFIFSTTCEGEVRWSQAIGGGGLFDKAFKIALDSKDNIYVGAFVNFSEPDFPVHFSPEDIVPPNVYDSKDPYGYLPQEGYKTSYIAKYNSSGVFQWKKALQGDVNRYNYGSSMHKILIDSKDNIHFIVGLTEGVHLDKKVTVAKGKYQLFLVQMNSTTQVFEKVMLLPTEGFLVQPSIQFNLDEKLGRYYISGFRSWVNVDENVALSYQGTAFTKNAYILAVDAKTGAELWRREMDSGSIDDCRIYDLDIDSNGDLFIGGNFFRDPANGGGFVKFINPRNPTLNPYTFKLNFIGNMPFIAKLNSSGDVIWARTPTGYNWSTADSGQYYAFKVALNGNEVALATHGMNTIWDDFQIDRPKNHLNDPILMRFNKKTGAVLGMHDIMGLHGSYQLMTAVEVDNDGNYVVGGAMEGSLFNDNAGGIETLYCNGHYDFYVAKLAAGPCGKNLNTETFNPMGLQLYPNPTRGMLNVVSEEQLQSYVIHNLLGQQVQNGLFNGSSQVNIQDLAAGTYFITIQTQQEINNTLKVIKN
ncbi:T9SS type A sorting domain-containing protein [Flavobacterium sp. HSC-61S13]|uniref:T9SS type A sorting domain-containing protein n=1 Tax=Flavobacterium sp. HSC-61S13 TaxID=2910963 RepID=UPI0020A193D9|nr:T9SS type A sorting domain-containing protein [Flavobacterium sp. HSC-61S13]MCP1994562.1 outer membrane protein assembly factor BamB [Flavobacterium sp. HSC-61S13]